VGTQAFTGSKGGGNSILSARSGLGATEQAPSPLHSRHSEAALQRVFSLRALYAIGENCGKRKGGMENQQKSTKSTLKKDQIEVIVAVGGLKPARG
jgi:hypothetical protein